MALRMIDPRRPTLCVVCLHLAAYPLLLWCVPCLRESRRALLLSRSNGISSQPLAHSLTLALSDRS